MQDTIDLNRCGGVESPTRRLDWDGPEARICSALSLPRHLPLPRVEEETLFDYFRYLEEALSFPFVAQICQDDGHPRKTMLASRHHTITVLSLLNPAKRRTEATAGLLCVARKGGIILEVPLAEVEVEDDAPNHRLIDDYWYWFWNCQ